MEGYRAFQHLSAANAEAVTTIDRDREFDQTARSETPGPRSVSPAILEHRIQMQDREIRDLTERLRVATERIAAFERMSNNLSQKLDEFEHEFKAAALGVCGTPGPFGNCEMQRGNAGMCSNFRAAVTGTAGIPDCGRSAPMPNEYEIGKCVFPRGHSGACSIGV